MIPGTDGDRIQVNVGWPGRYLRFAASLVTGDADMDREPRANGARRNRALRLTSSELEQLQAASALLRPTFEELDHDPWGERSIRVQLWRGRERIVIEVDAGRLAPVGVARIADLVDALVIKYIPWSATTSSR